MATIHSGRLVLTTPALLPKWSFERKLSAQGIDRHSLGRETFIDKVWEWKAESGGHYSHSKCAASATRSTGIATRFTMDDGLSAAVQEVFVRLYEDNLIYRGKRLVNWDPKLKTAISDLEVEN